MNTIKEEQRKNAEFILKMYGSTLTIEAKDAPASPITGYNIYNKQQETLNLSLRIKQ
jgi:hypothetical protein